MHIMDYMGFDSCISFTLKFCNCLRFQFPIPVPVYIVNFQFFAALPSSFLPRSVGPSCQSACPGPGGLGWGASQLPACLGADSGGRSSSLLLLCWTILLLLLEKSVKDLEGT